MLVSANNTQSANLQRNSLPNNQAVFYIERKLETEIYSMNYKQPLIEYIQAHLERGTSVDFIRQQLIDHGWDAVVVDETIREITKGENNTEGTKDLIIDEQVLPEAYGLREAFTDAYAAVKYNVSPIAILTLIGMGVPILLYTGSIISLFVYMTNASRNFYEYLPNPALSLFMEILPFLIVVGLVMVVFSIYTQVATSLAINDGVDKKHSKVKKTAMTALKKTPRLLLVGLFFSLLVSSPTLACLLTIWIIESLTTGVVLQYFFLGPAAIGLSFYLYLKFALMPVVAIFEPKLSLKQLYKRTKRLMSMGGVLFYFKFTLVMLAASMLVSGLTPEANGGVSAIGILMDLITIVIVPIFGTAVSVVFYRNRLVARG